MKSLLFVACLSLVLALGCGKKEEKKAEAPKETPGAAAPAETKSGKTFTDDDFIEYWAQTAYLTDKFQKDPIRLGKELNKLYEKLGFTEREGEKFGERYAKWMENWQKEIAADPQKAGKEWDAISKKLEKRLAELKAGQ